MAHRSGSACSQVLGRPTSLVARHALVRRLCHDFGETKLGRQPLPSDVVRSLGCRFLVITCKAATAFDARWPDNTLAGSTDISGSCLPGFVGAPKRNCSIDGEWSNGIDGDACIRSFLSNPIYSKVVAAPIAHDLCARARSVCASPEVFCEERIEGNAVWPKTATGASNVVVTLNTCLPTYSFTTAPSRVCMPSGAWGTLSGSQCQRTLALQTMIPSWHPRIHWSRRRSW